MNCKLFFNTTRFDESGALLFKSRMMVLLSESRSSLKEAEDIWLGSFVYRVPDNIRSTVACFIIYLLLRSTVDCYTATTQILLELRVSDVKSRHCLRLLHHDSDLNAGRPTVTWIRLGCRRRGNYIITSNLT